MCPDVRAAGAGIIIHTQNLADLMILEAGRENIRRTLTTRIGHQHDRSMVFLPFAVGKIGRRNRKST